MPLLICCFRMVEGSSWWLNEPRAKIVLPLDVAATLDCLIVLDVNGVLLKSYRELPKGLWILPKFHRPQIVPVEPRLICVVRLDVEQFLQTVRKKTTLIV